MRHGMRTSPFCEATGSMTKASGKVVVDPADADAAIATITYRLVATRVQERVSLAVSLAANGAPGR
jgi:polyisoprenoid-binding protein YceI